MLKGREGCELRGVEFFRQVQERVGAVPDSAGQPERPGRYSIITVAAPQKPGPATMSRKPELLLMRLDGATGRAWLAKLRRNASWEQIKDVTASGG